MSLRTCVSGGKGLWRGGYEGSFLVALLVLLACGMYFCVCVCECVRAVCVDRHMLDCLGFPFSYT